VRARSPDPDQVQFADP